MRANAANCLDKIEEMSWTDIGARLRIRIPGGRDRGCGASRVSAAVSLREEGYPGKIIVFGDEPELPY
jgi:hypothetical protein